jgi:hypothetical protein
MIITERDMLILKMCLEQKFLLLRQIARKFFPGSSNIYKVPARRVNLLMKEGYLKALKPRVGHETLYLATLKGERYVRSIGFAVVLRAVKGVDLKTYEHDVWVTDVRIIMEKARFRWTSERVLKKEARRGKVPDGMIISHGRRYSFLVEVERTLKNKRYYERMFLNNWMHYKDKQGTLFLVARRTMIQWFKNLDHCEDNFYFATIYDLFDYGVNTEFTNKNNEKIIPYQCGDYYFNASK